MNKINLFLIQTDLDWENPDANRKHFEELILGLDAPGLVILPEMFTTGFSMRSRQLAEDMSGETLGWMKRLSQKTGLAICGSIIISESGNYYNRLLFVTPDDVFTYDKRHLFSIAGEDASFTSGNQRLVVQWQGWRIMPLVCYDLRFPVWSRNRNDYDMLIYVANWPASRRSVWDALLKARAIENQAVVIGVNRIGCDGEKICYNGGTCLINERGETLVSAVDNATVVLKHTLNLQDLSDFRQKFSAWKDADEFTITTQD